MRTIFETILGTYTKYDLVVRCRAISCIYRAVYSISVFRFVTVRYLKSQWVRRSFYASRAPSHESPETRPAGRART